MRCIFSRNAKRFSSGRVSCLAARLRGTHVARIYTTAVFRCNAKGPTPLSLPPGRLAGHQQRHTVRQARGAERRWDVDELSYPVDRAHLGLGVFGLLDR